MHYLSLHLEFDITAAKAKRRINYKTYKCGEIQEVLICNYDDSGQLLTLKGEVK